MHSDQLYSTLRFWSWPVLWILNHFSSGTCGHLHWSFHDERRWGLNIVTGWRSLWWHRHPQFSRHWWGHSPFGCCRYVPNLTCRKKINILWLQNSKQRILFFLGHAKLYTNKNCWIMKGSLNLPMSVAVAIMRCLQMNSRWRQCTTLCSSVALLRASLFPLQHIYLIIYMLIIFQNPCKKKK